jgi:RHS repeat-associated protein
VIRDAAGSVLGANAIGARLLLSGQPYFPELGLYHLGARFYRPALGRFLSPDPLGLAAGPNRFAYAGAQPVMLVDPSGLGPENPAAGVEAEEWRAERRRRIAEARAYKARTGRYRFEDTDKVFTLGLAASITVPVAYGTTLGAVSVAGTAGAYGGLSTALGLSFGIAAPTVAGVGLASGDPAAADKAVAVTALGASPASLFGGVVGMGMAENPEAGLFAGAAVGAGVEGIANVTHAGLGALLRRRAGPTTGGWGTWEKLNERPSTSGIRQQSDVDCGPACVEILEGVPQAQTTRGGELSFREIFEELHAADPSWQVALVRPKTPLPSDEGVAILFDPVLRGHHTVIVRGRAGGRFTIEDPWEATIYEMTAAEFQAHFTGVFFYK